jgi:long-chain acyl-CoA synthetase
MTDPLAVLANAAAAAGGRLDQHEAAALVAAGYALLRRSVPLVRALAGRRAAVLLPTSPAFLVALAASEGRGAVLVNPLAAPAEVLRQLADADVGAVFTVGALAGKLPDPLPAHVAVALLDEAPRAARVLVGGAAHDVDLAAHRGDGLALEGDTAAEGRDEEATIVYTSAMAGRPLGSIATHRNLLSNARATVEAAQLTPADHALAVLPVLAPVRARRLRARAAARRRARHDDGALQPDRRRRGHRHARRDARRRRAGRVRRAAAGRRAPRRRAARPRAARVHLRRAPLPLALQERWAEATGVELRQGYGLTEAGPVCLFNRLDRPNHRGTMGVPFPGVRVEIRDPDTGAERPAGHAGELWVHGPNVSPGYVRDGHLGLAQVDGWLRTGDLGVAHADGAIEFTGLLKPMFTRNGFNIYPREIEQAVLELSGVRAVTVTAVPEPAREHDIALRVEGDVTADAVQAWCAAPPQRLQAALVGGDRVGRAATSRGARSGEPDAPLRDGLLERRDDGGSYCVPAQRRTSSSARATVRPPRYGRWLVIASNESATAAMRAASGMRSRPGRRGRPSRPTARGASAPRAARRAGR